MGTNRKLPFGYRMDFGRIAVQPEEAKWVRYIFSQYNQGMPFSAITDKMRNSSMPYDGDNGKVKIRLKNDQIVERGE